MERKIFVMGGGGFAMEPTNLALDRYILTLADRPRPKVCFVGTASGDASTYIEKFYNAYNSLDCTPSHLSLFKPPTQDLEDFVLGHDIVHVGGGNTKNLLCLWREWGLDFIMLKACKAGVVLTGMSAGMICWFEEGVTDSFGEKLAPLNGLGALQGSACPHFDGEANRKPTYLSSIRNKTIQGGIALDDGAGALYINERLDHCVSSRPNARAYWYDSETAKETILPIEYLGSPERGADVNGIETTAP